MRERERERERESERERFARKVNERIYVKKERVSTVHSMSRVAVKCQL